MKLPTWAKWIEGSDFYTLLPSLASRVCLLSTLSFLFMKISSRVLWKAASPCLKTHNSVWYCNWLVKTGHVGCLVLSSSLYLLLSVWWLQLELRVGHVPHRLVAGAQKAASCHPALLYFARLGLYVLKNPAMYRRWRRTNHWKVMMQKAEVGCVCILTLQLSHKRVVPQSEPKRIIRCRS